MPPVVFPPSAYTYPPAYPWSPPPPTSGGGTVEVRTGGGQGTSDGTVNVYNPPIALPKAAFTYRIYAGGLVAFTNTSLNNPTLFNWNFGDGNSSTAKNPFHYYPSGGTRTVTLTVQNSGGINSTSQSVNVTILASTANFSYVTSGLKVFITDTSTVIGTAFSYDWGDGSAVSTSQNPTHTYAVAGDYLIRQVVNGTYVKEQTVSVALSFISNADIDNEDMADITDWSDYDYSPGNSSQVTFDGNSCMKLDSSGTSGRYALREQDIGTFGIKTVFSISIYCDVIDTYSDAGYFRFMAYNGVRCLNIFFASNGLFVYGLYSPNEVGTDLVIQDTWQEWTFDVNWITKKLDVYLNQVLQASGVDCCSQASGNPNGTVDFNQPRGNTTDNKITYIDWLKVGTDFIVINANLPVASFSTDVNSGIAPLTVNCTDTSTGDPETWLYEWGDGTANGTTQNPSHVFTTAGNYTVKLTVANDYGTSSYIKTIHVSSVQIELTTLPPIASFTADAHIVAVNATVAFTDTSTGGTATTWSWKKNGIQFATTQNATHQFTTAGVWTVSLTVTDAAGMSSTATHTIIVTSDTDPSDNRPTATITPDKTAGFAPTTIAFSATVSTPDIFYLWDFGDGNTSTLSSVSHIYTHSGVYTVTLTTTNLYGSTTATRVIVIAEVRYADLSVIGYYIIDKVNHKILIYGTNGALISAFGGLGSGLGQFHSPTCVLVNK